MKKRDLFYLFSMVLIISLSIFGCDFNKTSYNQNKFRANNSIEIRDYTFYNCQHLINQTVNFTGKVIFEECGTNCLGACIYSGPDYCYYGIQDRDNCTIYISSRIDALGNPKFKEMGMIFNKLDIGQAVQLRGNVALYYDLHCSGLFSCNYFMLENETILN